jgi:hypothetical protein
MNTSQIPEYGKPQKKYGWIVLASQSPKIPGEFAGHSADIPVLLHRRNIFISCAIWVLTVD